MIFSFVSDWNGANKVIDVQNLIKQINMPSGPADDMAYMLVLSEAFKKFGDAANTIKQS